MFKLLKKKPKEDALAIETKPKMPAKKFDTTKIIRHLSNSKRAIRRFAVFLIVLLLICGVYILTTNGLYYWLSRPMTATFIAVRAQVDAGVPLDAVTEQARLAYYQDCLDQLQGLPEQIGELNHQPWTFAVLIRENFGEKTVPEMQDLAVRGMAAIAVYFDAVDAIRLEVAEFMQNTSQDNEADIEGLRLRESLVWYTSRIADADRLEKMVADLASIPDVSLVGQLASPEELGLNPVSDKVAPYREPVNTLKDLLSQSDEIESQISVLYISDPSLEQTADTITQCEEIIAAQTALATKVAMLDKTLPLALRPAFDEWSYGLTQRILFVQYIEAWWQNSSLAEQSLLSAASDRATARRYIADSLAEPNVETAYLWTQTAQSFRDDMSTAIDFANIYIDRINSSINGIAASRIDYRTAFGLDSGLRVILETDIVSAEAYWLQSD